MALRSPQLGRATSNEIHIFCFSRRALSSGRVLILLRRAAFQLSPLQTSSQGTLSSCALTGRCSAAWSPNRGRCGPPVLLPYRSSAGEGRTARRCRAQGGTGPRRRSPRCETRTGETRSAKAPGSVSPETAPAFCPTTTWRDKSVTQFQPIVTLKELADHPARIVDATVPVVGTSCVINFDSALAAAQRRKFEPRTAEPEQE